MQAQTEPHTSPCWSSSALTRAGSMWLGSSTGISTVSNPHFLKVLKRAVLLLVNGEVNRNVLMPNLILENVFGQPKQQAMAVKAFLDIRVPLNCHLTLLYPDTLSPT